MQTGIENFLENMRTWCFVRSYENMQSQYWELRDGIIKTPDNYNFTKKMGELISWTEITDCDDKAKLRKGEWVAVGYFTVTKNMVVFNES